VWLQRVRALTSLEKRTESRDVCILGEEGSGLDARYAIVRLSHTRNAIALTLIAAPRAAAMPSVTRRRENTAAAPIPTAVRPLPAAAPRPLTPRNGGPEADASERREEKATGTTTQATTHIQSDSRKC